MQITSLNLSSEKHFFVLEFTWETTLLNANRWFEPNCTLTFSERNTFYLMRINLYILKKLVSILTAG